VGLACTQAVEGTDNCNCAHLNTFYQTFSCDQQLSSQPHKRSKAHFWCMCAQAPPSLRPVSAAQCLAASAFNTGSCSNKVTCPRTDGSCGINVYGHRSSDKGMTCTKACNKLGLGCYKAIEGTNNCACNHMNTVKQEFGCDQDLSKQPHKSNKAYYWCHCIKLPTPLVPLSSSVCQSTRYKGSCSTNPGYAGCPISDGT
jgi:hypothetical protein